MDGQTVIDAYHDLYQVERTFRMAKSDLRARPVFHHDRDAIEAHLTVVFAALAVARELQARTGASLKKLVQTLRQLRTVTIDIDGHMCQRRGGFQSSSQPVLQNRGSCCQPLAVFRRVLVVVASRPSRPSSSVSWLVGGRPLPRGGRLASRAQRAGTGATGSRSTATGR